MPKIFTSDEVTSENHWQIASRVTQKSIFRATNVLFYFLHTISRHEYTIPLKHYRSLITLLSLMHRSQPAVRATTLACLVLRRSYVSNSASSVADWGLKVILQPPYQQRTFLAAAVPPTHRIARRKSHSEGTFNVLAPCLRGTFNVRSPCHRSRVRTAVCVSVPQWYGAGALKAPLTCVARTDISSLPRVYIAS